MIASVSGFGPPSGRRIGPPSGRVVTMPGQLRHACTFGELSRVVGSAPEPGPAETKLIVPVGPNVTVDPSTRPPISGPVPMPFSLRMGAVVENPSRVLRPATRAGGNPLPSGMATWLP